jgi:hypothetical protein
MANKVSDWKKSAAKALLYADIVSGDVHEDMEPFLVYGMKVEYQEYEYRNFKTNLRNLLKVVRKHQGRASRDAAAVDNDILVRPPRDNDLSWHGSTAQKLLQQDFKNGFTEDGRKPKDIYDSRPEYKLFKLRTFRHQLYDLRQSKERIYWMNLKKG